MRNEDKLASLEFAPGTHIAVTQFHEIDRSLILCLPFERQDLLDAGVDLDERALPQEWVERSVLQPDVAVHAMPDVYVLDDSDRHFAPDFHHTGQEVGLASVEPLVKSNRKSDCPGLVKDFNGRQMSLRKRHLNLQLVDSLNVHTKELKKVAEFHMVNDAQAVELVNAWDRLRVFDLRKPRIGDVEFFIPL